MAPMEFALELIVVAQRMPAMSRMPKHVTRLFGQGSNRRPRRDVAAMGCLARNASDRAPRDRRHGFEQMARLRIAMQ